jgi:cysteine desulfurase / selenocysteine lyase
MKTGPLSREFGPFNGHIWLNAAHQGPLPASACVAGDEALHAKRHPYEIRDEAFWDVPARLRGAIARLLDADPAQVALTNSTTYGINVVAQGLDLRPGDEVLIVDGDFPATVLPWLSRKDVSVRFLDGRHGPIDPNQLEAAIGPRTRVFCTSWVFSFLGYSIDLRALSEVCHRHDVLLVVNGSQAIGARPLSLRDEPMDALSCCGFKWLCGPYATGFAWFSKRILERLDYPVPNWLRAQDATGLDNEMRYQLPSDHTGSAYDVFCTANFMNYLPLTAAVEHLNTVGIDVIAAHDQQLVSRLIDSVGECFDVISPRSGAARSTLVLVSHERRERNRDLVRRLVDAGIHVALREDNIRVSPHLYNSHEDIDRAADVLLSER